ncbi:maltodextrin glucosidase [Vibrio algarum]|uniref:Maltodextrin glucosidase n=1 Tax=Vibrio algarum TaxID=3020714 RepID=A0ABT4YTS9_9VIBR|nr:maltodextrin glucosidase [Vibrio sp. KJ40-1]MDB1124453.1 maltodextrin glucosidase [Vibrio sp. KJ40-1]
MNLPYLRHVQTPDGLCFKNNVLTVTLTTEDLKFDKVQVRHEPDNEEYLVDMSRVGKEGRLVLWKASIPINSDRDITHYVFKIIMGKQQFWLDARCSHIRIPGKEYHFKFNANHQPPAWVSEQVFYQIFPDRFCNGNPQISVKSGEYQIRGGTVDVVKKEWGSEIGDYKKSSSVEFYGGDLQGIKDKLDYLQDLGITSLYLNPIFQSNSNHKYDTTDYLNVDSHLGTNEDFAELSKEIHARGLKIVLDAVFNHTSEEHPWFDKNGKGSSGAYHHIDSPYRHFYLFDCDSKNYLGWKGVATLPVLNFENEEVRNYIYQSDQSVIKHWLREPYAIDGWRFDVIHMLGEGDGAKNNEYYVRQFREATKSVSSESYVLGEHFFEATQWLQGDQEDGSMNYYGFAHPVRALLAELDISYDPISLTPADFIYWIREANAKIPWLNQLSQLNQLDSHDTVRFLTMLKGDEKKMRMAAVMLFTFVGTPCLYYGTEVGLVGEQDPDNRRCFPWERVATSSWIPFFKGLIRNRTENAEWQKGSFEVLSYSDDHIVYARKLGTEVSIVALSFTEIEFSIPVWKLGIENANGRSYFEHKLLEVHNGELILSMSPWQVEIVKIGKLS